MLQTLNNEENRLRSNDWEKERKTKKVSRKARSRNIVQIFHSDCDEELQSVVSDNPHMYMRSRSSVRIS